MIPVTVWRWDRALAGGGVAGLVPARKGPRRASKLTPQVAARIRELDGQGRTQAEIAAAGGVSESSVRNALRPARPAAAGGDAAGEQPDAAAGEEPAAEDRPAGGDELLPVLPDPAGRDGERALARFGLLGEGAAPVFLPGARYPLAGLLLALPALEGTGLLACARAVYGRLRNGFYGLETMLVLGVFQALLREPRAEGAARIDIRALGRVLGLDRAPEVKTIRRKLAALAELAAAGKAAELQMAIRAGDANPAQLKYWTQAWLGRIKDLYAAHDELTAAWHGAAAPAPREREKAAARLDRAYAAWDQSLTMIDEARKKQVTAPGLQQPARKALATLDREWDGLIAHRGYPMIGLDNAAEVPDPRSCRDQEERRRLPQRRHRPQRRRHLDRHRHRPDGRPQHHHPAHLIPRRMRAQRRETACRAGTGTLPALERQPRGPPHLGTAATSTG